MRTRPIAVLLAALVAASALAGCGSGDDGGSTPSGAGKVVTIATHDSWNMDEKVMADFTAKTGIKVRIATQGDAGELTNKLVLTKDHPIADGVFGIDNTFASRAVDEGVLAPYSGRRPASAARFALDGAGGEALTPVDYGDVCVNVDDTWFAKKKLAPPSTLDDLADPAYRGLFVTPGATTSSPGLAFLLATIGRYGEDGWQDYWRKLVANDVKVDAGWEDAYTVDFTAGGGKGTRPIVLSYSSSPPFTIPKGATEPTTSALLDTCFRQVEYAGVLAGAKNPQGAQQFIDFMLTRAFQQALPDNMYVYPVDAAAPLPAGWDRFARTAPKPFAVAPDDIAAHRSDWLREWRDIATG